jgi:hypothetical protein
MSNNDRPNRNEVFTGGNKPSSHGMGSSNVLKDDFGFEIPVEVVPLPSNGVTYPVDSTMHGKETIQIRAMTAREEDILTSKALIKKGTVITHLLKSCIVDEGVNPDELLSGDRNAVMTALRITGYGTGYHVEVDCPACGERSKQEFNLAELPIKRLEISPVSAGANLFETDLPVTKKKVQFKFLTGNDETEISRLQERKKKQGQLNDNLVTTRLQFALVTVGGISDKNKLGFFIRNMPARDSLHLRKYIDRNEPGIDMKSWMDCPSCLEHSEVRLPMGASFFWPETD